MIEHLKHLVDGEVFNGSKNIQSEDVVIKWKESLIFALSTTIKNWLNMDTEKFDNLSQEKI